MPASASDFIDFGFVATPRMGKLFDFSTWDVERMSSRVINPWTYIKVNGPALTIALVTYLLWTNFGDFTDGNEGVISSYNALCLYLIGSLKGYTYIIYLYWVFKDRKKYFTQIHDEQDANRSFWSHVFWCSFRSSYSAIFLEILNTFGVFYFFGVAPQFSYLFILKFFCWEIWFDFGHYWGHRIAHIIKPLYEFGHIVHHESLSPDAWDGLNITLDDAFLTNFLPHMLAMTVTRFVFGCVAPFSTVEYHILGSYKTFVEVTGHVGVDFRGRSFPLVPIIPYYLGIDIGTAAYHSLHHLYHQMNFSKRFTLWDRVFGTMKIPPVLKTGSKKEILRKYRRAPKNDFAKDALKN
eukprot:110896_1